eukprot:scaffold1204_cov407-Prasinococcus_capsulatus_cf.AAC.20
MLAQGSLPGPGQINNCSGEGLLVVVAIGFGGHLGLHKVRRPGADHAAVLLDEIAVVLCDVRGWDGVAARVHVGSGPPWVAVGQQALGPSRAHLPSATACGLHRPVQRPPTRRTVSLSQRAARKPAMGCGHCYGAGSSTRTRGGCARCSGRGRGSRRTCRARWARAAALPA